MSDSSKLLLTTMMMVMEIFIIIIMLSMMMIMIEIRMTMMLLMMLIKMEDDDNEEDDDDDRNSNDDNGACWLSEQCPCFHLGPDGERQTEGTDASRKRDTRSSAGHHKSEDTSDSREDEAAVSLSSLPSFFFLSVSLDRILMRCHNLNTRTPPTHIRLTKQQ